MSLVRHSVRQSVTAIELDASNIQSALPADLALLTGLERFILSNNDLFGTIPSSCGQWTRLEQFIASANALPNGGALTGTIPSSVVGQWTNPVNGTSFKTSSTARCRRPLGAGRWTRLVEAHGNANALTGILPDAIGRWTSVESVRLNGNSLAGPIRSTIGNWRRLRSCQFRINALTGSLPTTLGQWTNVETVDISQNQLTGSIPAAIGSGWSSSVTAVCHG
jgi:Leucine-rich repeat (LRR) protein